MECNLSDYFSEIMIPNFRNKATLPGWKLELWMEWIFLVSWPTARSKAAHGNAMGSAVAPWIVRAVGPPKRAPYHGLSALDIGNRFSHGVAMGCLGADLWS